ncbi:hypothetical protein C8R47DRAFT_1075552 [Mycena vitilis]|nr:hypothetical protein C8R47DRAFT_1075552 [Mycena vitilis]
MPPRFVCSRIFRLQVAPVSEDNRVFSMSELNEGSVPLPKPARRFDAPGALMIRDMNARTQPLDNTHSCIGAAPIGWGRPAAPPAKAASHDPPPYYSPYLTGSTNHRAIRVLEDAAQYYTTRNLPGSFAGEDAPHPMLDPVAPASPAFYPYVGGGHQSSTYSNVGATHAFSLPSYDSVSAYTQNTDEGLTAASDYHHYPRYHLPRIFSPSPVHPQPRRKKYYGPFDACSREDVLPEFQDGYEHGHRRQQREEKGMDGGAWIQQLRTLMEHSDDEPQDNSLDSAAQSDEDLSYLQMERHAKAVRKRILATDDGNASTSEVPTGLRGLPLVVQVKAVYPAQVWGATLAQLELQSEASEEGLWMASRL